MAGVALFAGGEGEDESAAAVGDVLSGLEEGNNANVYVVGSSEELQNVYEELGAGGEVVTPSGYDGEMVELPDGTRIGLRNTSSSGGPTIDINQPGRAPIKVHLANE